MLSNLVGFFTSMERVYANEDDSFQVGATMALDHKL